MHQDPFEIPDTVSAASLHSIIYARLGSEWCEIQRDLEKFHYMRMLLGELWEQRLADLDRAKEKHGR
jgi:hypothetical protein